jgi:hypothetical protein
MVFTVFFLFFFSLNARTLSHLLALVVQSFLRLFSMEGQAIERVDMRGLIVKRWKKIDLVLQVGVSLWLYGVGERANVGSGLLLVHERVVLVV